MAALRGAMTALRSLPRVATGALGGMAWGAATRGGGGMAQAHVARLSIGGMGSSQRDAASGREWSHGLRQPGGVSVASVVGHALAGSGLQFSPAALRGFTTSLPARQDAAAAVMEKEAEKPVINTLTNPAHNAEHHDFPRARSLKRKFKTSVKKLMMVCKLVRRARVDAALMQLTLSPKRAARTVRQLIYDAKFNASNNHGMDPDRLLIDEIKIGRAGYLKRVEYKGRGKTGIRRRPYCYCAIYVREIQPTDDFVFSHLKRRRPKWKCGPINRA